MDDTRRGATINSTRERQEVARHPRTSQIIPEPTSRTETEIAWSEYQLGPDSDEVQLHSRDLLFWSMVERFALSIAFTSSRVVAQTGIKPNTLNDDSAV